MKLLTDTWRQLVQRRLWPGALLLLGALVAVPFVLGSSPEPVASAPVAPAASGVKASAASADPIVSMVSDDAAATTRRSLGDRHNPFASSAPKHKAKTVKKSASSSDTSKQADDTSAAGTGSGGSSAPTTTTPTTPTTTVPAYAIVVRFGSSDGDLTRKTLARNEALPDEDNPVLVYMGAKNHGKTAVFMVSEGLTPTGDGTCKPTNACETIELGVGETEFFDVGEDAEGVQYELDVVKIYKRATKVPVTDEDSSSGSTGTAGALG